MIFLSIFKKIMYFVTALIPSILILEWYCPYLIVHMKILVMLVTFIVSVVIGLILRKIIFSKKNIQSKQRVVNFDGISSTNERCVGMLKDESKYEIDILKNFSINNNFIPFLTSIVIPLFLKNNNWFISIITMIMLLIFSWNSSDCFPNIILSLLKTHLISTSDGFYIFYRTKDRQYMSGIKPLYFISKKTIPNCRLFVFKIIDEERN